MQKCQNDESQNDESQNDESQNDESQNDESQNDESQNDDNLKLDYIQTFRFCNQNLKYVSYMTWTKRISFDIVADRIKINHRVHREPQKRKKGDKNMKKMILILSSVLIVSGCAFTAPTLKHQKITVRKNADGKIAGSELIDETTQNFQGTIKYRKITIRRNANGDVIGSELVEEETKSRFEKLLELEHLPKTVVF